MKNVIIIAVKLAVICLVAAFVLALVNGITAPQIAASKAQAELDALSVINKAGTIGEKVEGDGAGVNYYFPVSDGGKVTNYIMSLKSVGYGGDLILLANFKTNGEVIDAKLMEDAETPGLGKKAESPEYMVKFQGTGGDKPVPVKKTMLDAKDADAVSGATITFTGVSKALEYGSEFAKKLGGQK
ncbi:MAG: FMN-binding protein [Spirochaetia bacterium]|nr:FMN-binding protein [Spirochaetia bacterium]MBR0317684.1 FMN-binding protein [Spirochaetia bacterium]